MTYKNYYDGATRSSVMKAIADGENEAAWERLFNLYAGLVFSIARSKGLKEEDADDIVQIVFSDLARNLPTFEYNRTKGRFRSYLIGLIHWRIKDKLRIVQRDKEFIETYINETKSLPPPDKDFAEREWQAAALEEALRRIKPEVRPEQFAAFYASVIEGQDTESITQLYNISRDNLYQIRKRLTAKLKPIIATVLKEMDDGNLPHVNGENPLP